MESCKGTTHLCDQTVLLIHSMRLCSYFGVANDRNYW